MLERPKLTDDAIIAKLQSEYDLLAPALEFLPIGNDARAWSFRVETATSEYFLKLRRGTLNVASLIVPHYLLKLRRQKCRSADTGELGTAVRARERLRSHAISISSRRIRVGYGADGGAVARLGRDHAFDTRRALAGGACRGCPA